MSDNLFDYDSTSQLDKMVCNAAKHRAGTCGGEIWTADDPKLLLLGYSCILCGEEWTARLTAIKHQQSNLKEIMKTNKGRKTLLGIINRIGYLFIGGDDEYMEGR